MSDLAITVRGKRNEWVFRFRGNKKYLNEWRADGLVVDEAVNSIPTWVVDLGLTKPWCWLQDRVATAQEEKK